MMTLAQQWREIIEYLRGLSDEPPNREPDTPRHSPAHEPHEPSILIKRYAESKFHRRQHKGD